MALTTHVAKHMDHAHLLEPVTGLLRYVALFLVVGLLSGVVLLIASRLALIGLMLLALFSS